VLPDSGKQLLKPCILTNFKYVLVTLVRLLCQDASNDKISMRTDDLYNSAHLFVAAIRVWEYHNGTQPSVDDVCASLSLSIEQGLFLCRKLKEMEIIDEVESAVGNRLFIKNHAGIEDIPQNVKENNIADELKKFQDAQKNISSEITSFQAKQTQKKKNLFADMEKKLKAELDKH